MGKPVLTPDQRREAADYRALGFTHSESRRRVMTPEQRQMHYEQIRAAELARRACNPRREMLLSKKQDAARRGIEFTITEADLDWPTHCPVLGIVLHCGSNGHGDGRRGPRRDAACIDRRV